MSEYCHFDFCERPAHTLMKAALLPLCFKHAQAVYLTLKDYLDSATPSEQIRSAAAPKAPVRQGWKNESGFVYFMDCGDVIKIGWSKDPVSRRKQVGAKAVLAVFAGTQQDEKSMHMRWGSLWSHGEYFNRSPELVRFIEDLPVAA